MWQGPEKQGTSVDLSTLSKPKPTSLPTITELADDSRYAPETGPAGAFSDEMLEKKMLRSPESRAEHGAAETKSTRVQRTSRREQRAWFRRAHQEGRHSVPVVRGADDCRGEMPYRSRNRSEDFMALDREKIPTTGVHH